MTQPGGAEHSLFRERGIVLNDPNDSDRENEQLLAISEQFVSVSEQSFYVWCFSLKGNYRLTGRRGERIALGKDQHEQTRTKSLLARPHDGSVQSWLDFRDEGRSPNRDEV